MQQQYTSSTPRRGSRLVRAARVSTVDQEVYGTSLEDQLGKCSLFAQLHDLHVVDDGAYAGDESGALPVEQRPILQHLLADARAGRFDAVVWHKIDRIARSARAILEVWSTLEDLGITIYVIEPPIDSSDPFGRLMRTILAAFAEFERDMIVVRTMGGHLRKVQRDELYLPGGKYGYTYAPGDREKGTAGRVERQPEQAHVVVGMYQRRAQGATAGRIARELNAQGIPSPRGRGPWTERTVARILADEAYHGRQEWGLRKAALSRHGKRTAHAAARRAEPLYRTYPQIVDDALWAGVRAQDQAAPRCTQRSPDGKFLLAGGRARCAEHDRALVGTTTFGDKLQYRCQRTAPTGARAVHCWRGAVLEGAVWDAVIGFLLDPERGLRAARRLAAEAEVSLAAIRERRGVIASALEDLARQAQWVRQVGREVGFSAQEMREDLAAVQQQATPLREEDGRLAAQEDLAREDLPGAERVAAICRQMAARARSMGRPERAALLADLEVQVLVYPGRIHISGKVKEMATWVEMPGAERTHAETCSGGAPAAFALEVALGLAS